MKLFLICMAMFMVMQLALSTSDLKQVGKIAPIVRK